MARTLKSPHSTTGLAAARRAEKRPGEQQAHALARPYLQGRSSTRISEALVCVSASVPPDIAARSEASIRGL